MPQKKHANRSKMTKLKKTAAKSKKTGHGLMVSAEKMEKEFRTMPAKIAQFYKSELMTVKQQETRLKTELKKVQTAQMTSQKKLTTLAKSKTKAKPAMKKMLATAKKIKDRANKSAKDLATKLSQIHKTMLALDGKQAKFTALGKMLGQLESHLAKKTAKSTKVTKKTGKKTIKRVKQKQLETTGNTSQEMPPMMSSNSADDSVEMN